MGTFVMAARWRLPAAECGTRLRRQSGIGSRVTCTPSECEGQRQEERAETSHETMIRLASGTFLMPQRFPR
jgi:hypothetical protein